MRPALLFGFSREIALFLEISRTSVNLARNRIRKKQNWNIL